MVACVAPRALATLPFRLNSIVGGVGPSLLLPLPPSPLFVRSADAGAAAEGADAASTAVVVVVAERGASETAEEIEDAVGRAVPLSPVAGAATAIVSAVAPAPVALASSENASSRNEGALVGESSGLFG